MSINDNFSSMQQEADCLKPNSSPCAQTHARTHTHLIPLPHLPSVYRQAAQNALPSLTCRGDLVDGAPGASDVHVTVGPGGGEVLGHDAVEVSTRDHARELPDRG